MLTSKKDLSSQTATITLEHSDVNELLETEWLLTNSRGGFACGTIAGCNTRRYHGLLVGSLNPPANRIVAISNCHETLTIENREVVLGCFEFDEKLPDTGSGLLTEFSKDIGAHFDYDLGPVRVTKSILIMTLGP
jgi:predicted glycogen debranching enzyme